jgi:hypothetical protein
VKAEKIYNKISVVPYLKQFRKAIMPVTMAQIGAVFFLAL